MNDERRLTRATKYGKKAALGLEAYACPRIVRYAKSIIQLYKVQCLDAQEAIEEIEALLEGFDQGIKERKEREKHDGVLQRAPEPGN
jgi:hypothetical protein